MEKRNPRPAIKIGTLCSDCTNPEEKVMQSYVFDLGNIVRLGMYEKARMSAEVLCERGDDPADIARETLFPVVRETLLRREKGEINEAHAVKSLEAASVAMAVFRREDPDWDRALTPGAGVAVWPEEEDTWEVKLLRRSLECCGFLPELLVLGNGKNGEEARLEIEEDLRRKDLQLLFVQALPGSLQETRQWLTLRREAGAKVPSVLFTPFPQMGKVLKLDADFYCQDPLFGGTIAVEQLLKQGMARATGGTS